jgi:2-keto-4-pentenoate hydratase
VIFVALNLGQQPGLKMSLHSPLGLNDQVLSDIADRLAAAHMTGEPCDPIRSMIGVTDLDAAYAIQDIGTERALNDGRRIIGRKIGLTSPAVQRQLGVNQPDFGILFADMVMGEGIPIPQSRLMQPKIEAEIALILGRDLNMTNPTIGDIIWATEFVVPALEIVGSRIRNWDIQITDTIADNASSGLLVLGGPARKIDGLDLRGAVMTMTKAGEVVSKGSGGACLGHPLNAAAWLAGEMVRRNRSLRAGDLVLTGALGAMVPVSPGDSFEAQISGIGQVSAVFE